MKNVEFYIQVRIEGQIPDNMFPFTALEELRDGIKTEVYQAALPNIKVMRIKTTEVSYTTNGIPALKEIFWWLWLKWTTKSYKRP